MKVLSPNVLSAVALALAFAAPLAHAAGPALQATGAWSRPAVAGTNGVGYLTIANRGGAADALLGVTSPAAGRIEMHASAMSGGVMSMSKLDRIPIPAGGQAVFAPGAYHLMLMGLKTTLKPGDQVPATLAFASGARLKVAFTVSAGMGPPAAMDHMNH